MSLSFAFIGLSLCSSWGNGHATTYRGLLRELSRRGHSVTFFERDAPWYLENADLPRPDFCRLVRYRSLEELALHEPELSRADAVIVGSYVPEGPRVLELVLASARGVRAFYDIDTPVTLAALARRDCDYLSEELVPELDLYLSFSGGASLELLRSRFRARRVEPLYCSVDPALYRPEQEHQAWTLGYLGTYSRDRQPALEELLLRPARAASDLEFVVGGPQYPASVDWPPNVSRFEHVPPSQHSLFYSRQRWTLNVTRRDMVAAGHSPSVRLFEAAACGVPIISDAWPGLDAFFTPGSEIVVAESAEAVLECVTRTSEGERRAIAERARKRVLAEHTAAQRAATLEDYVRQSLRSRGSPWRSDRSAPLVQGGA